MGFWNTFFGGEESNPEEEKKNADAKNFDLLKYDGVKAMRMGQAPYAVKCFREALKLQDDLETRDYLSRALVATGSLPEALAELKTIAAAASDNVEVVLQAAHVAYMMEDYDEMAAQCEQALRLDDSNAFAHYQYGQACLGKGELVNAIAWLTKAIAANDQLGDARLLRAQTLMAMGDVSAAKEDVQWLLQNSEPQEDVLLAAARLALKEGNADEAIGIYDRIIEMNPFQIDAYRERGKTKFDQGDKEGAEEDMQKLLELDPQALGNVTGNYEAEGIEHKVKEAYSFMNPFGI